MTQQSYFTTCNGSTMKLSNVNYMHLADAARYRKAAIEPLPVKTERYIVACGGGRPPEYAYAVGLCQCGSYHLAERRIERPSFASDHKCDGRCVNARGRKCECSCKGENHGAA